MMQDTQIERNDQMDRYRWKRWASTAVLLLVLTACTLPGTATPSIDNPTPTQPAPAEETREPTITPAQAGSAPVITAENVIYLNYSELGLPEYIERLLWPEPGLLPQIPEADLLLQSGPYLHPVVLQPIGPDRAGLGYPVGLPLNGGTILAFAPDASSLLVQDSGQLALYSPNGQRLHVIEEDMPLAASFSPDGLFLAINPREEMAIHVYDASSGQRTARLTGFETAAPVYTSQLAPGGKTALWISRATIQGHDIDTGTLGFRASSVDFVSAVAFHPNGGQVAVAAGSQLVIYSLPGGETLGETILSDGLYSLDYSPDGRLLAAAYGNSVQLWNAPTLEPVGQLDSGASTLLAGFSPDGRFLVSVQENNTLRVWRADE
jgi:hypothetical protein